MTEGARRIAAERIRQIEQLGFSPSEDVKNNVNGELSGAASAYASYAQQLIVYEDMPAILEELSECTPDTWCWDYERWKPSPDEIRNLEKAGALIAAEIDRLLATAKECGEK